MVSLPENPSRLRGRILLLVNRCILLTGRDTRVSPALTVGELIGELTRRGCQLTRGVIRLRQPVFLDRGVRICGRRRLQIARGVSVGRNCDIDARSVNGVVLSRNSRLGQSGVISCTSKLSLVGRGFALGKASGIGDSFHIGCSGGVYIGDNVIIGPMFTAHSQEHNFKSADLIRNAGTHESPVYVSDNCWIGARVTLLAGTRIGPNTVIAAGAVVRGEHAGNELLAGVPARQVKSLQ
jgi:acetyltransferase-like isoleucine patch superfamily enzyme